MKFVSIDAMAQEETPEEKRLSRIATARSALAAAHAANPEGVARYQSRMAKLAAARKRERERFETKCLGRDPEPEPMPKKPAGMTKAEWRVERTRVGKERQRAAAEAARFRGRAGTPQTLAYAASTHTGSLEQLERNGTITKDQREWAAQIANVYRSIEAEVGLKVASFEARIDQSRRAPAMGERIHRVRMHRAYAIWRDRLPSPKALVLDMIVGDAVGYSVAARRHRVHNRKAKRELVEAIKRWPLCVAIAFSVVDEFMVHDMNRAVAPIWPAELAAKPRPTAQSYEATRLRETERHQTDEPYLLPPVDPAFLDERGFLRPMSEISSIIVERSMALAENADDMSDEGAPTEMRG